MNDVMWILDRIRQETVSDAVFIAEVDAAVDRGDEIVIAYAQGTLDNLDHSWPELERALARWCPADRGPHVLSRFQPRDGSKVPDECEKCGEPRRRPPPADTTQP